MGIAKKLIQQAKAIESRTKFNDFVKECVQQKKFTFGSINLKELAIETWGDSWENGAREYGGSRAYAKESATGATGVTAFRDVIGAMTTSTIEDGFQQRTSIIADLFSTVDSVGSPTGTKDIYEKFSATGLVKPIAPGTEYPRTDFRGLRVTMPEPVKHGLVGALTLEAVMENDSKGYLKDQLDVGRQVGDYVNDLRIRVLTGLTNNFTQNGTAFNTYLTSGAWANQLDDFDITTGPVAFDRADMMFEQIVHPVTGRTLVHGEHQALALGGAFFQVASLARATEVRVTNGTTTTIGTNSMSITPIKDPETRRIFAAESGLTTTQVNTHVFYGDFPAAFSERVVLPFEVFETADQTDVAFFQDIVYAVKARYWGVPFVRQPRFVSRLRKLA